MVLTGRLAALLRKNPTAFSDGPQFGVGHETRPQVAARLTGLAAVEPPPLASPSQPHVEASVDDARRVHARRH